MSTTPRNVEEILESFLAERRSGSRVDARAFAARHPDLEPDVIDALESLEALEIVRSESAPALVPTRVGPFRILREIGRGGMGVVLEAVEEPLGRRVALKLLPPEMLASRSARARFQREAALAARLDHSGICTVYGAGVLDERPWIAMRCVEGATLGKRITAARARKEGGLKLPGAEALDPARAVAACIARVARALAAAHAQGVLHRDVKPSNVMVTPGGEPVLLDFGLAIEPDSDAASLTHTGEIAGTPAYLAPELIAGENVRSDAQCDVYSLGVTLYECLTLEAPFRGPTREALYRAILAGDASDVRGANASVPRDLAMIVATALERDRAARYASAELFALDLEAFVEHRPIAARAIGPWGRLARWARREPRQAALAVGLALTALVSSLMGGILIASRDKVRAGELAQRAREIDETVASGYVDLGATRREEAAVTFARALALDPGNEEAWAGRVFALLRLNRNDEVLAMLRDAPHTAAYEGLRALAENRPPPPEDPEWLANASASELFLDGERWRLLGERRPDTEQVDWMRKALARFDEAIMRAPHARPSYHQLRAFAAAGANDVQAARSAASTLARLWPDSEAALYQAGASLVHLDARAALPLLERAAELGSHRAATFQCLGMAQIALKDHDRARVSFERALEIDPRDAAAFNGLAAALANLGCRDEQRVALLHALEIDPDRTDALSNLGMVEWDDGDLDAAARDFERVLELDPGLTQQRRVLALLFNAMRELERARDQMAIALAYAPHDPGQWADYARHLIEASQLEDARTAFEIARSLDPSLGGLEDIEAQLR